MFLSRACSVCRNASWVSSTDSLKLPSIFHKPKNVWGALHMTEVCQSPVPISKKFTDNKAECNLKHWAFSPRMSHYHVLIMLISQPLESCPAFHCQRRVGENDCGWGLCPTYWKTRPSVPSCMEHGTLCFVAEVILYPSTEPLNFI